MLHALPAPRGLHVHVNAFYVCAKSLAGSGGEMEGEFQAAEKVCHGEAEEGVELVLPAYEEGWIQMEMGGQITYRTVRTCA